MHTRIANRGDIHDVLLTFLERLSSSFAGSKLPLDILMAFFVGGLRRISLMPVYKPCLPPTYTECDYQGLYFYDSHLLQSSDSSPELSSLDRSDELVLSESLEEAGSGAAAAAPPFAISSASGAPDRHPSGHSLRSWAQSSGSLFSALSLTRVAHVDRRFPFEACHYGSKWQRTC